MKSFSQIEDILSESNKAEMLEKLGSVLSVDGCKVVIITGIPNKETGGIDVEVLQTGHKYRYEEHGFIMEGANIVEGYDGDE